MRKLRCPDCGSENLVRDENNGDLTCQNCEAVLDFCGECGDLCHEYDINWSDLASAFVCDNCWQELEDSAKEEEEDDE